MININYENTDRDKKELTPEEETRSIEIKKEINQKKLEIERLILEAELLYVEHEEDKEKIRESIAEIDRMLSKNI